MKIKTSYEALQSGGLLSQSDIRISDDPEDQKFILNALTSTLYTDKIGACLREYAANGMDANVEAGHPDRPIEVTLPNKFAPFMAIRDFGFGLSEDQILTIFCRLGRSTKRDSDELTGAYGIGSKAAFGYGDSFMVTSFTKGEKAIYNAYRDNGMPKIAKMHEESTEEADGIEVKVPVRLDDIGEFVTKAERVYRYFRIPPIIKGATVELIRKEQMHGGDGWRYIGEGRSVAIMGNMGYVINADSMGNLDEKQSALLRNGIELDFNMGDIEVSLNREGLQYVDATRERILARLNVAIEQISKVFVAKIAKAPTMWAARNLYGELFERSGNSAQTALRDVVDDKIMWKGHSINTARMEIGRISSDEAGNDTKVSVISASKKGFYGRGGLRIDRDADSVYANEKNVLVINDLSNKRFSPSRVNGFFDANPDAREFVLFTYADDKTWKKHWKARHLTGAPRLLLSSIPPRVKTSGSSLTRTNTKHSSRAFTFNEKHTAVYRKDIRSDYWDSVQVDLQGGSGVFVWISKFETLRPGYSNQQPGNFSRELIGMRASTLLDQPVHGFKESYRDKLGPGWVELQDYMTTRVDAVMKRPGFALELSDYNAATEFESPYPLDTASKFPVGSGVREMLEVARSMGVTKIDPKLASALLADHYLPWLQIPSLPDPTVDLNAMLKRVYNDYPLLELIGHVSVDVKPLADYVKLVLKSRERF